MYFLLHCQFMSINWWMMIDDLHLLNGTQLELEYCCVSSVNRKNGKKMQRVWVHGKFLKLMS
jgi:hypothetical protein